MTIKLIPLFIFSICLLSTQSLHSQYRIAGKSIMELKNEQVRHKAYSLVFSSALSSVATAQELPAQLDQYFNLSKSAAPKVYSYDELGMFCKFEVQIEKATRFPVKIRLGEVEAVDRKEGKWQYDNWHN